MMVGVGLFIYYSAFSQVPLAPEDKTQLTFSVLRDVDPSANIADMCCGSADFPTTQLNNVSSRYGESALWLKITDVKNTGLIQLTPILDSVTLFARSRSGKWLVVRTGDSIPKSQASYDSPLMALQLSGDRQTGDMYVRIIQPTKLTIRVTQWSTTAFGTVQSRNFTIKAFLLGGICAVILYNIFVSLLVKSWVFLANAFAVISIMTFSLYLSGIGQAHLWENHSDWSNPIMVLSLFGAMVFGALFLWQFMRRENEPGFSDWILFVVPVAGIIPLVMLLFTPYWIPQLMMLLCGVLSIAIFAGVILRNSLRGNKNAIIMNGPILFAIIPGFGLTIFSKIWGIDLDWVSSNSFEIALFAEAILFSLALASKMRSIEMDTHAAHHDIIKLRNENTSRVIVGQDMERKRIAADLHDGVGQDFLLVLGSLKKLQTATNTNNQQGAFTDAIRSTETALDNLRDISREMHPSSIEHLGLEEALRHTIENTASTYQIDTRVDLDFSQARLSQEWQLHIYRVIQGCLSNLVHHSKATYFQAHSEVFGNRIRIILEDNGIGIDGSSEIANNANGMGLASIQERVRLMNGLWSMQNSEQGGTIIKFHIPLVTPDLALPTAKEII